MNKITAVFQNKKARIAHIIGGDPNINTTKAMVLALEGDADIIQISLPFSDPIVGALMEQADKRALAAGTTTDGLFQMCKELGEIVRRPLPLIFMAYANSIFAYGSEKFMKNCAESGVDGLIVVDLPFVEKAEFATECDRYNICLISTLSPTTPERITAIAKDARGLIYCQPTPGTDDEKAVEAVIQKVKEVADIPCVVDNGVYAPSASGVVVADLIQMVADHGEKSPAIAAELLRNIWE